MYLSSVYINNFKNFKEREFTFSPRINCIIGQNGVGKTNLLDSIHYLSFCKSYFNYIDSNNIRFNESFFFIQGQYFNDTQKEIINCSVARDKRKIMKRNDKEYERLSEHIGTVSLIMITPSDISLINGGSEERRRFFDVFISQFNNEYLQWLIAYNKYLGDRNKLLKQDISLLDKDYIAVLDERLAVLGEKIFQIRKATIEQCVPIFTKYYAQISGSETIAICYESQLTKNKLLVLLANNFERDCLLGHTSQGIHRDDFSFLMNDVPIKMFGSQGQKKSFLLVLKFTQQEYTFKNTNIKPILLLDDLFDKLDKNRVEQIIAIISSDLFGQIFISDTDKSNLKQLFPSEDAKIIEL